MTTCAAATAACGPGAKMNLAYATGPFSVPNCPAGPSRTTEGLILYGAMGRRHMTAQGSSLKSAAAGCEPIPAFPLLPEPSACPAWPSAASATSRCEPILAFPLIPGPSTHPAWPSAASAAARCEPVPTFPLLPGPPTCPAWLSAVSVAARCEPFPTNRLTPAPCNSGS